MSFTLENLTYVYRGAPTGDRPALVGLTADVPDGRTTAVLGLSGSGKTTLLKLLGMLLHPRLITGRLVYRDPDGKPHDYARLSAGDRTVYRRAQFGFVLQSACLVPHLSCLENIAVPLALRGVYRGRTALVERLLDRVDPSGELAKLRHKKPRDVSGGERQRMAIVRAIIHDPHVLFADEPFSNLDPCNTVAILRLLAEWQAGKLHETEPGAAPRPRTLILVSHSLETALRFAGCDGTLPADGQMPAVFRDDLPQPAGGCLPLFKGRLAGAGLLARDQLAGGAAAVLDLITTGG